MITEEQFTKPFGVMTDSIACEIKSNKEQKEAFEALRFADTHSINPRREYINGTPKQKKKKRKSQKSARRKSRR